MGPLLLPIPNPRHPNTNSIFAAVGEGTRERQDLGKGGATFGLLIFDLIHSGPVVARNRARIFARKRETGNGKEIIKAADTKKKKKKKKTADTKKKKKKKKKK